MQPESPGETVKSMAHLKFIPQGLLSNTFLLYQGSQTEPPCRTQNWLIPKTIFKVLPYQVSIKSKNSFRDRKHKFVDNNFENLDR